MAADGGDISREDYKRVKCASIAQSFHVKKGEARSYGFFRCPQFLPPSERFLSACSWFSFLVSTLRIFMEAGAACAR